MADKSIVLHTLIGEAAGESDQGMYAVASTMVNRAKATKRSLEQVVTQPHQYSAAARRDLNQFVYRQGPDVYARAQAALAKAQTAPAPYTNYLTTTLDASPRQPRWAKTMTQRTTIGHHVFGVSR